MDALTIMMCPALPPNTPPPFSSPRSNYSFPFVAGESFVTEAQTDQVVIIDHDWVPEPFVGQPPEQAYLGEWHGNMTQALSPLMAADNLRNGVFNPACFIHTSFSPAAPKIDGVNYLQAFGDFYYQRTPAAGFKKQDDCGITCNPTCP
jgi:hypothetical protein